MLDGSRNLYESKELDLEASLPGSLQTILLAALVTRTAGDSFTHSSWILTKNPCFDCPNANSPIRMEERGQETVIINNEQA